MVGRVAALVGQGAAIGIKGHLAEVKKIALFQFIIVINVRIGIIVCKQSICGGLVVFVVDGTIGVPSRTIFQTVLERSQSSRSIMDSRWEQPLKVLDSMVVTFSGMVIVLRLEQFTKADAPMEVTLCGMVNGLQRSTVYKGALANGLNAVIQRKRCEICAACKGSISHRLYRTLDGKSIQVGEIKGLPADGSDALWNGDVRQIGASLKGIIADRRNIFT